MGAALFFVFERLAGRRGVQQGVALIPNAVMVRQVTLGRVWTLRVNQNVLKGGLNDR
jgi:hypothetical protein